MAFETSGMPLLQVENDLIEFTGGRTLDDICRMPSDDRRAILSRYLVEDGPVPIQEPIAWSDEESIGRFLSLKKVLGEDESRKHLLLEARRAFYEENSFIICLGGFSRFLDDMLGDWEDSVPVEMLVHDLTIRIEREECQCGQLMEYVQRLSYFAKMPQLRRVLFEWDTPNGDEANVISQGWNTLSSNNSSSTHLVQSSTDDNGNYHFGDNDGHSEGGILDDDAWSLEEGVGG
ncbi:uncharacterized protein FTOL_12372 [Fusarium torulosum]|uniref:Uncharacterized protein n=1 Tax=Fusarium torulosum TaxID=33205 RepID=A0AAE8MLY7_9HYPO|nr:uncharacterized protein FTOL_12372 [Fusarium torulosum]